jgi:hypothetical protein
MLFGVAVWFTVGYTAADRIILKDGQIVESDKVWETERYVHFILKGTKNVEVRYSRKIVDRIIRGKDLEKKADHPQQNESRLPSPTSRLGKPEGSADKSQHIGSYSESAAAKETKPPQRAVQSTSGTGFYDPRRPQRYWAATNSRHATLDEALEALAKQYGRSAQWVATHMGQENDLRVIHQNLLRQINQEKKGSKNPPESVQFKLDDQPETGPAQQNIREDRSGAHQGIQFYDPRRPDKYWISPTSHFKTMEAAIDALAAQYGVDAAWIADHMGSTNDLDQIHNTIQQNLQQEPNQQR